MQLQVEHILWFFLELEDGIVGAGVAEEKVETDAVDVTVGVVVLNVCMLISPGKGSLSLRSELSCMYFNVKLVSALLLLFRTGSNMLGSVGQLHYKEFDLWKNAHS